MNERLLQYIWLHQHFKQTDLRTIEGEELRIVQPGQFNHNQGPDFLNGKIELAGTTWVGNIELHMRTSDWERHQHQQDPNYNNVILHAVWEHDQPVENPINIPVLELKQRIPKILLDRYQTLMNSSSFIPCEHTIRNVPDIIIKSWKDRLLAERLTRKSKLMVTFLQQNNYHWEESFWWLLARNFGMTVNTDSFEAIARSIPLNVLAKHKSQVIQLESLLFGQAGLLGKKHSEAYPKLLSREYRFLQTKYKLHPVHLPLHFLRMRPSNFPSIRLAQLAALIAESSHLFSRVRETDSLELLRKNFDVTANDYWHYHYRFGSPSSYKRKNIGSSMMDNIIINTICPALFTHGQYYNDPLSKEKAIRWLEQTGAETNSITRGFEQIGMENLNAFDSQALIELKSQYCDFRNCLECSLGNWILNTK